MAGYTVDHVSAKIIITNEKALTDAENLAIADLRMKGYSVEVKKRKNNKAQGKTKAYYKSKLTKEQWAEFEKICNQPASKKGGFFAARKYAKELGVE